MDPHVSAKVLHVKSFVLEKDGGYWLHPDRPAFGYTDGAKTEQRLLRILRNSDDCSTFSPVLQRQITDWPTRYHFSPDRHNLLRHLDLSPQTDVLELGAGCGAITRYLGENAGTVWAVEGSATRAACAAARTRDLPNVRVFCSDFQAIDPGRQFDVVTLIGVLEYAPVFFDAENPLLACLKLAKSRLRPGGTLIVAIENQLGLKYFCGAPEDHTGHAFDGIADLYRRRGPRTCGRAELAALLAAAGFGSVCFQFPFPDYKLPTWVFTERGFNCDGFDPSAILRLIDPVHDGQPIHLPVDQRRAAAVLHRNHLLGELANSFLVLAADSPQATALCPANLLAAAANTGRRACFTTQTRMLLQADQHIVVHKSLLQPAAPPPPPGCPLHLHNVPGSEPYRRGTQLEQLVVDALAERELDAALALLRRWVDYLIEFGFAASDAQDGYASPLRPEFVDCNPRNLIVDEAGRLQEIDREWIYVGPLTARQAVLRYLKPFASRQQRLLRHVLKGRQQLVLQLAGRLGMPCTRQQYEQANQARRAINRWTEPDPAAAMGAAGGASIGRRIGSRLLAATRRRGEAKGG